MTFGVAELPAPLESGERLPAHIVTTTTTYVMGPRIGEGGMGEVRIGWRAAAGDFRRLVAIKRIRADGGLDEELPELLAAEARATSGVHHPNVVSVIDVGLDGSDVFLVMDYIHGASLRELRGKPIPTEVALAIAVDVLLGLEAAHAARGANGRLLGLVHRDVTPHNVLIGVDGYARITDFGVAHMEGTALRRRTRGKLGYVAPEQLAGADVSVATDVYGASVVLWEMLAGTRMPRAPEARPPSDFNSKVSLHLDAIVLRGLARRPESRFQTAGEMALAIDREACGRVSPLHLGDWLGRAGAEPIATRSAMVALGQS